MVGLHFLIGIIISFFVWEYYGKKEFNKMGRYAIWAEKLWFWVIIAVLCVWEFLIPIILLILFLKYINNKIKKKFNIGSE